MITKNYCNGKVVYSAIACSMVVYNMVVARMKVRQRGFQVKGQWEEKRDIRTMDGWALQF